MKQRVLSKRAVVGTVALLATAAVVSACESSYPGYGYGVTNPQPVCRSWGDYCHHGHDCCSGNCYNNRCTGR